MGVGHDKRPTLLAQRPDLFSHDRLVEMLHGPLPPPAEPLRDGAGIRGVIRLPDPLPQRIEGLLQGLGPLPDLQERMQEAEDDRDPLEERRPGRLRGGPAVGVDGPGPVRRVQVPGRIPEHAVGPRQLVLVGPLGQRQAQAAPAAGGGRQLDLLAAEGRVLLVGDQMTGPPLGGLDGGPDQAGSPQGAFQARPGPRVPPEDLGQGPVGPGELAEKRGACTSSVRPVKEGIRNEGRTRELWLLRRSIRRSLQPVLREV